MPKHPWRSRGTDDRRGIAIVAALSAAGVAGVADVAGDEINPTKLALETSRNALRDVGVGAELYRLARNFLLYIALVIITALLQHYYFPESIKRGLEAEVVVEAEAEAEAEAAAPLLDETEDAFEEGGGGPEMEAGAKAAFGPSSSSSPPGSPGGSPRSPEGTAAAKKKKKSNLATVMDGMKMGTWEQERASKREVLTQLSVCVCGLLVSFLVWGVLQERMLTKPYNGDYFTSSYGLVFLNRLGGFLISGAMLYAFNPPATNAIVYRFAFPAVSNMLSSWCQYEALKYVSFPTQMLFKCFKLFPVMLMGKILGTAVYPTYEYVVAVCVGVGIAIFATSTEDLEIGQDSIGEVETVQGTLCGIILLLFFLVFDSFTGQYQSRMFKEHPSLSPYHMMFLVNTFSMVFSFITLVHTNELATACTFVYTHAEMHIHLIVFSLTSTIGQLFIFKTIKNFGPVVFAICMNTRIILSIMLSSLIYSHDVSPQGLLGLLLVFGGMGYRIKRKTQNQKLISWADDDKSLDVFHEWHEHADM